MLVLMYNSEIYETLPFVITQFMSTEQNMVVSAFVNNKE